MSVLTRTLFVAADAADKDLVLQWAGEGKLPCFQRLLSEAAWGTTANPPGLYVGAVWPSFATGASPAWHHRYCFNQLRPGTYETPRFGPADMGVEPFWNVLGRAGKRLAVLDISKTPLSSAPNVTHVVDWGTHDPEDEGFLTLPPQLAAEITRRFGRDPVGICDGTRRTAADFAALRDKLIARTRTKTELILHFLNQGGWDGVLASFSETHCAGHHFWHLHDPSHPRHDSRIVAALGSPLLDVYRAVDEGIGRVLEAAGPDASKIVLASHGMGPHYEATFMLHLILERLERDRPAAKSAFISARGVWQALVPASVRGRLFKDLRRKMKRDHRAQPFFQVPNNDPFGAVQVNLAGREPDGCVRPGEEYEALCRSLAGDFLALVNTRTGRPAVSAVHRSTELYPGQDASAFPDLLIEWNREAPLDSVESPKTGRIDAVYRGCRTGDHRAEGLFFMTGAGVRTGRTDLPVSVTDFAPTLAELAGSSFAAPDGRSLLPALRSGRRV